MIHSYIAALCHYDLYRISELVLVPDNKDFYSLLCIYSSVSENVYKNSCNSFVVNNIFQNLHFKPKFIV